MKLTETLQIENKQGLEDKQILALLDDYLATVDTSKQVLIVAPDITRHHSNAGRLTSYLYAKLSKITMVKVLIALGSHQPMDEKECQYMYEGIPYADIINHNWRTDTVKLGEVDASYVSMVSQGLLDYSIDVEVNKHIVDSRYSTVISIGQVVPHEVVGMANGNKNIFVGCGGASMINKTHFLGAVCDMEKMMGRDNTSVRRVFDHAERTYLSNVNLNYILLVLGNGHICGTYIGADRRAFENAVAMSQAINIIFLDKPLKKVIVNLTEREYRSTWLGNKSIYRTRLAIDDNGELLVLGKGIERFGEDDAVDQLIRKYGYVGRDKVLELTNNNADLENNLSASAHLIHGSSNGRFSITYAVKLLTREQIEGVNFNYADYDEVEKQYNLSALKDGYNIVNGESIYYIENPSVGLWACKDRFDKED